MINFKKDTNANRHLKAKNTDELIENNFQKLLDLVKIHNLEQIPRLELLNAYGHGENVAIKSRRRKDKYAANYQIAHNFGEAFVSFDTGYNVTEPITLKLDTKDDMKHFYETREHSYPLIIDSVLLLKFDYYQRYNAMKIEDITSVLRILSNIKKLYPDISYVKFLEKELIILYKTQKEEKNISNHCE